MGAGRRARKRERAGGKTEKREGSIETSATRLGGGGGERPVRQSLYGLSLAGVLLHAILLREAKPDHPQWRGGRDGLPTRLTFPGQVQQTMRGLGSIPPCAQCETA